MKRKPLTVMYARIHTDNPLVLLWKILIIFCVYNITLPPQTDCSPGDSACLGIQMNVYMPRFDCLSRGSGTIAETTTISFRAVWQGWAPLYITLRMGTFTGRAWRRGNGGVGPDAQDHLSNPVMLAEIWLPEIIMEVSCLDSSTHDGERSRTV